MEIEHLCSALNSFGLHAWRGPLMVSGRAKPFLAVEAEREKLNAGPGTPPRSG